MVEERLGERIGTNEELIKKASSLAMKAHSSTGKQPYIYEKSRGSSEVFFAFSGSWSIHDWFPQEPFGETKVNLTLFPSMRSISNAEPAIVNQGFMSKFQSILESSSLQIEVDKSVNEGMQVVFTGHSSGGPLAIFATLWFLDKYVRPNR